MITLLQTRMAPIPTSNSCGNDPRYYIALWLVLNAVFIALAVVAVITGRRRGLSVHTSLFSVEKNVVMFPPGLVLAVVNGLALLGCVCIYVANKLL